MNDTKTLFQSDKPLTVNWKETCTQDWFPKVLMHARSSFMEQRPTQQEIIGADAFLSALLGLADAEETFQPMPGPGLIHNPIEAAKELKKQPKKS